MTGDVVAGLGNFEDGVEIAFQFEGVVNMSLPKGVDVVYNQGTVSGSNFNDILTDDTAIPDAKTDPTETVADRPPTVTAVFLRGSSWPPSFRQFLQNQALGDAVFGARILDGAGQLDEVPWINANEISIRFSEPVNVAAADLQVFGANVPSYVLDAGLFTYDAGTKTATWRLGAANPFFSIDKIRLVLNGSAGGVTDAAGNQRLDGEWDDAASLFPSGDGVEGGDFSFRLTVVAGDVNRDGSTTVTDLVNVGTRVISTAGPPHSPNYLAQADVNGDASITVTDLTNVGTRILGVLPTANPGGAPNTGWLPEQTAMVPSPGAAPTEGVTATKVDFLAGDTDGDNEADPGDKLLYEVKISNNSGGLAQGVNYMDTLEPNLTLGNQGPAALPDSYSTPEAIALAVPAISGLRSNDFDIDGLTPQASLAVTIVSPVGTPQGSITSFAADGSFTYVPPTSGFGFVDTFMYTVDDGDGLTGTGYVSINVLVAATPPVSVDDEAAPGSMPGDDFHAALNTTLNVTDGSSEDLLINDSLGAPAATLVSFGGGDLGGIVTDNGAGSTASCGGTCSLTVQSDGSFAFMPDTGFAGSFTFDYRIQNAAGMDDASVTLAVGERPSAVNDAISATGNVTVNTAAIPFSVLDNDGGDALMVTSSSSVSVQGGDVSVNPSTGTFTYNPPSGFEGADSFSYAVDNGFGAPSAGTVNITVNDMIWFIDSTATCPCDGRMTNPFDDLAVTVDSFDVNAGDDPGDNVFLAQGTYNGGLTLLDNQKLIGDGSSGNLQSATGVALAPGSTSPPAFSGVDPVITSTANGVNLGQNNTLRGLTIGDTPNGTGLIGTGVGSLTVSEASITGTGQALDIDTGSLSVTLDSVAADGGPCGLRLNNVGGSFTVTGITDVDNMTNDGIEISNSNAAFSFGSVEIDATGTAGVFLNNNAGAVTIGGGSIGATTTTSGVAVDVDGGAAAVNLAADITNSTNRSVEVSNRTGGNVTLSGAIADVAAGINVAGNTGGTTEFSGTVAVDTNATNAPGVFLTNNAGHTVNFTGNLDIDTNLGGGFFATSGGTVNVSAGPTTTIDTGGGTPIALFGVQTNAGITFDAINKNGTGNGVLISGVSGPGSFTISSGTIQNITVRGVDIDSSSIDVSVGASLNNSLGGAANRTVEVTNYTGTASFTGSIDENAGGVNLTNNTGGNIGFTGGIDVVTTASTGFNATGGGTVGVSGGANTISTATGTGLLIQNTTIGAGGLTFESISSNGGSNGIVLDNTGTSGGLTVTGTGAPGSGGTIQNMNGANGTTAGIGIRLNQTQNVSLTNMQLSNFSNYAIHGTSVTNFTLAGSTVSGSNGDSAADSEGSVAFTNLLGSAALSNSTIGGGLVDNVRVTNDTGSLNRLTVSGGTIGLNSTTDGNNGISVEAQGAATTANVTVTGVSFLGARGDMFRANNVGTTSAIDVVLQDNTFNNTHTSILSGRGGITLGGGSAAGSNTTTYNVSGTTAGAQTIRGSDGDAVKADFVSGFATVTGTIENNDVGVAGTSGSGSLNGSGITVGASQNVAHTSTINNNTIRGVNGTGAGGINIVANVDVAFDATITNNDVTEMGGFTFAALTALFGAAGSETGTARLDIQNNTLDASGAPLAGNAVLFNQTSVLGNYKLPSFGGSANGESGTFCAAGTASADISAYLAGRGNTMTNGPFPVFVGFVEAGDVCGVSNLHAAAGVGPARFPLTTLSEADLAYTAEAAMRRWAAAGIPRSMWDRLQEVTIAVADLPGSVLGTATGHMVQIDLNGSGYGWFVDATPAEDSEFDAELHAIANSHAAGRIDLLTVIMHELGHVLGLGHDHLDGDLMRETLATGARRLPDGIIDHAVTVDEVFEQLERDSSDVVLRLI